MMRTLNCRDRSWPKRRLERSLVASQSLLSLGWKITCSLMSILRIWGSKEKELNSIASHSMSGSEVARRFKSSLRLSHSSLEVLRLRTLSGICLRSSNVTLTFRNKLVFWIAQRSSSTQSMRNQVRFGLRSNLIEICRSHLYTMRLLLVPWSWSQPHRSRMCSLFAVTRKSSASKTKWSLWVTRQRRVKLRLISNWEPQRLVISTSSSCSDMRWSDVKPIFPSIGGRESNLTSKSMRSFSWSPRSICRKRYLTSTTPRLKPGTLIRITQLFETLNQRSRRSGLFNQIMALGTCRRRNPKFSSLSCTRVHLSLKHRSWTLSLMILRLSQVSSLLWSTTRSSRRKKV